jgi:hypothetical protein
MDMEGRFYDLSTREVLDALRTGPPLYGRELAGRLSDTVLRQFIQRQVSQLGGGSGARGAGGAYPVVAISLPPAIWKILSATDSGAPRRFLYGAIEWASPSSLVLSYTLDADTSLLSADDLRAMLARHLVELRMSPSELAYRESQREGIDDA